MAMMGQIKDIGTKQRLSPGQDDNRLSDFLI
jgi:hypothetical protein